MAKKSRPFVQERRRKQAQARKMARIKWRLQKVYGGKGRAVADGPSTSVRAVPTGFETNRRRH